jgi:TolA-binding protein
LAAWGRLSSMSGELSGDRNDKGNRLADAAVAARAWIDVLLRVVIAGLVLLVLLEPGLFPILKQFTLKSGEVNVFGSKFEITEVGSLIPGLEIRDNRILLQGKDISTMPDTIDRLTTAYSELQQANVVISEQLKSNDGLLQEVTNQRDEANQQLVALRQNVPSAKPLDTAALDTRIQQQIKQTQQLATVRMALAPVQAAAAPTNLVFGVAFGSDTTHDQAMTEVNKARKVSNAPIALFQREKYLRSVAAFATREAATAALSMFRSVRPDAYIVDFRTWCPAALNRSFSDGDTPTVIDCRF